MAGRMQGLPEQINGEAGMLQRGSKQPRPLEDGNWVCDDPSCTNVNYPRRTEVRSVLSSSSWFISLVWWLQYAPLPSSSHLLPYVEEFMWICGGEFLRVWEGCHKIHRPIVYFEFLYQWWPLQINFKFMSSVNCKWPRQWLFLEHIHLPGKGVKFVISAINHAKLLIGRPCALWIPYECLLRINLEFIEFELYKLEMAR